MGRYAALPTVLEDAGDGSVRILFSGRDERNRASIGAVVLNLEELRPVEGSLTPQPLLAPGALGAFDDSGVTVSSAVHHEGRVYLYYTGWALGQTVPFYFAIGLAVSDDGGRTFARHSQAPIMGRHPQDPYLCASPAVLLEDELWRMWYVSGLRWEERPEAAPRHYYLVRYADSDDGIHWRRHGIALDFQSPDEYAMGRPCVRRYGGEYHMWLCARGDRYRLGYARSPDGRHWTRNDDDVSLAPEAAPWEAEMQAYPTVHETDGRWWLLYNGNGFGATGIGLAEGIFEQRAESTR